MKRMMIVPLGLLLMLAGSAVASPICGSGSVGTGLNNWITSYVGSANACLIGDKLFYDFTFAVTGPTTVTPDTSQINLSGDTTHPSLNPGLVIQTGQFFLFGPDTLDVTISYNVATASGAALIEDYSLTIAGGNGNRTAGFGSVTESFNPANDGPLVTGFGPGVAGVATAHEAFAPAYIAGTHVSTHIVENGGRTVSDQIDISLIRENFSETPEPYAPVLIGSGLVLLGLRRKRAA